MEGLTGGFAVCQYEDCVALRDNIQSIVRVLLRYGQRKKGRHGSILEVDRQSVLLVRFAVLKNRSSSKNIISGLMRLRCVLSLARKWRMVASYVGIMVSYSSSLWKHLHLRVHTSLSILSRKYDLNEKRRNCQLWVERAPKGILAIVGV